MDRNSIAVLAVDLDEHKGHTVLRCIRCGEELTRWVTTMFSPDIDKLVDRHRGAYAAWKDEPLIPYPDKLFVNAKPHKVQLSEMYDAGVKAGKAAIIDTWTKKIADQATEHSNEMDLAYARGITAGMEVAASWAMHRRCRS